eukprot:Pgem_evm2s17169
MALNKPNYTISEGVFTELSYNNHQLTNPTHLAAVQSNIMDDHTRRILLDNHNRLRKELKVGSMRELVYDKNLECMARKHVEKELKRKELIEGKFKYSFQHRGGAAYKLFPGEYDQADCSITGSVGENMAGWGDKSKAKENVVMWVDSYGCGGERLMYAIQFGDDSVMKAIGKDLNAEKLRCNKTETKGSVNWWQFAHFTQVMNPKTHRVGCFVGKGVGTICNYQAPNIYVPMEIKKEFWLGDCSKFPGTTIINGLCSCGAGKTTDASGKCIAKGSGDGGKSSKNGGNGSSGNGSHSTGNVGNGAGNGSNKGSTKQTGNSGNSTGFSNKTDLATPFANGGGENSTNRTGTGTA